MKLAVVYPWTSDFCFTGWADNSLNLQRPEGVDTRFFRGTGWSPARRHADGCEKALSWGADLICIIGADQVHPEDMLPRLLKRYEETNGGIISALIPFRGVPCSQNLGPFGMSGWKLKEEHIPFIKGGGDVTCDMMERIVPENGPLQEANVIGSGVLLFSSDLLLKMQRPWFFEHIRPDDYQRYADMDTKFVWRLQVETGARLWIDTTINVRHLHVFEIDRTFEGRFKDWGRAENGWSFTADFIDYVRKSIPENSSVVEFGSGDGSSLLASQYRYTCVEHNEDWVCRYPEIMYVQARIKNGWYDREPIDRCLPKSADCYIVDGPSPDVGREGLLNNLDVLPNDKPIIFDDVNRNGDLRIAREIAVRWNRPLWVSPPKQHAHADVMCQFGVINPTNTEGLTLDVPTPGTTGSHSEEPGLAADEVLQAV